MSTKKSYKDLQRELEIILQKQETLKKNRAEIITKEILKSDIAEDLADMSEADVKKFAKCIIPSLGKALEQYKASKNEDIAPEQKPKMEQNVTTENSFASTKSSLDQLADINRNLREREANMNAVGNGY